MILKRKIFPKIEKELDTPEVVVITGMRQVGKTTLLNYLFDKVKTANKKLFDMSNPIQRKIFEEEDYDNIWNNLAQFNITKNEKAYLFIDEIQNMPGISLAVKYLYDHYKVKFFLTGSSSYYLKNLFPESMAGRKILFELFPLTFSELLVFKGVKKITGGAFTDKEKEKNYIAYKKLLPYYEEYIKYGGFPKVVLEQNNIRKRTLLEEVFTSYFELDVKSLADFKDLSKLRDLILLLSGRIGTKLDIVKLSSELMVSRETVYNYLEFLQKTYFLTLLPKHSSIDRRVSGGKKVYFCDGGLANMIGTLSYGQMFEQSVFGSLRTEHNLEYYDREGRSEIDFIIDKKTGLEAKASVSKRDLRSLALVSKSAGVDASYIVSLSYSKLPKVILATNL